MNGSRRTRLTDGLADGGAPLARTDAAEADTPYDFHPQPFVVPPDTDRHHDGSMFHDLEVTP